MYSYEDRVRAVELYLKLTNRAGFHVDARCRFHLGRCPVEDIDRPTGHPVDPAGGQLVSPSSRLRAYGPASRRGWRIDLLPACLLVVDAFPAISPRPEILAGQSSRRDHHGRLQPAPAGAGDVPFRAFESTAVALLLSPERDRLESCAPADGVRRPLRLLAAGR